MRMLGDAVDLYLFRAKSLLDYRYPWWQLAILISLYGLVMSGGSPELGQNLPGRIGFCIGYNWLESLLFAPLLGLWLGVNPVRFFRPLLAVCTLGSAIELLQPLLSWLPDDVSDGLLMVSTVYSLMVLSSALARVSGKGRMRATIGVLLFAVGSAFLMQGCWFAASRQGWVQAPTSWNPFAVSATDNGGTGDGSQSASPSDKDDDNSGKDHGDNLAVMP